MAESKRADRAPKPPRPAHIVVVGFADGHRDMAPWDDKTAEFWGLNRLHTVLPGRPWTHWFEVHDLSSYDKDKVHLDFLHSFQGPVFIRPDDMGKYDIPNAVPYPKEQMLSRFPSYFTNSISWMLALAITRNPRKISVFGVDMAQDHVLQAEYAEQRPSCEFFLGFAAGAGIQMVLPKGTDLLRSSHLYGFENPGPYHEKNMARFAEIGQRKENVKGQLAQLDAQRANMIAAINQLDGSMQEITFQLKNLSPLKEA